MGTPATLASIRSGGGTTPANQVPVTAHPPLGRRLTPVACAAFGLGLLSASGCGPPRIAPSVPAAGPARATAATAAPRGGATAGPAQAVVAVWRNLQLYGRYCAARHGDQGDGNGLASRFLYPKPRNFRRGAVPDGDYQQRGPLRRGPDRVLPRGLPGSAMFPFGHLSPDERQALINVVKTFVHGGRRSREEGGSEFNEEVNPRSWPRPSRNGPSGPRIVVPGDLPNRIRARRLAAACSTSRAVPPATEIRGRETAFGAEGRIRDTHPAPRLHSGNLQRRTRPRSALCRITLGVPGLPCPRLHCSNPPTSET